VCHVLGLGFAKKAAGHGHAGDGFEASEGDRGGGGEGGEGDGFIVGGDIVEDVEVEEPVEAGEGLVLESVFVRGIVL
jgi:hypothetical protein